MTTYTIHRYSDAAALGSIDMTAEQYAAYQRAAQQPEGIIALGDLPGDERDILAACVMTDGIDGSTTVYLD